ncbi:hypothetical protein NMY22_g11474 [Coprinellus aureogranulatus]|nr:hypothetical protein NMY22_g11474 [Coprinellus aureogranulatus]
MTPSPRPTGTPATPVIPFLAALDSGSAPSGRPSSLGLVLDEADPAWRCEPIRREGSGTRNVPRPTRPTHNTRNARIHPPEPSPEPSPSPTRKCEIKWDPATGAIGAAIGLGVYFTRGNPDHQQPKALSDNVGTQGADDAGPTAAAGGEAVGGGFMEGRRERRGSSTDGVAITLLMLRLRLVFAGGCYAGADVESDGDACCGERREFKGPLMKEHRMRSERRRRRF